MTARVFQPVLRLAAILAAAVVAWPAGAFAKGPEEPAVKQEMVGVGIVEKLDTTLPLDAVFTDHEGKAVKLRDYFQSGKPVVLNLVYYGCPGLCTAVLSGLSQTVQDVAWTPGNEYQIVTISFNPDDTASLAKAKRENYLSNLKKPGAENGWVFLTADAATIKALTQAVGFNYVRVEGSDQYSHSAAAIICTPDGRVSRYLHGAYYEPETFRFSLVEASGGKVGSVSDKVWMMVCGYDASLGKYVVMARSVLAAGGAATIVALVSVVGWFFVKEQKLRRKVTA